MAIYLRQICLVANNLKSVVDDLTTVFGIQSCYVDSAVGKFGLENNLLAIGSQFLEVVAPIQENTAAGRFLQRRGGDGGYMVICQVPTKAEQAEVRQRAAELGVRIAYESDRGSWNIMQLHPADMGAAFFEVDWDEQEDVTGNWHPAGGKEWQKFVATEVISAITAVELQSDDPEALAQTWAKVSGGTITKKDNVLSLAFANAELRFVKATDGRGAGLSGIDLKVIDRNYIEQETVPRKINLANNQLFIGGVRFNLISN